MFRFKHFGLKQEASAMKIGTDGVILGAWVSVSRARRIVDVGTGSGLLACMLAQRSAQVLIDAIEIEPAAAQEASENVERSPWNGQIRVFPFSLESFLKETSERYDLLVSNPPFFSASTKPADPKRSLARHAEGLSAAALVEAADRLLHPEGRLAVVYPPREAEIFLATARNYGFSCIRRLRLSSRESKPVRRWFVELQRHAGICQDETLCIYKAGEEGETEAYIELVKDFLLQF